MAATQTATLIRRTPRTVTVRLTDGTERTFAARDVLMVWCGKNDLDPQIEQRPHRQTEVTATIHGATLVLAGEARYI